MIIVDTTKDYDGAIRERSLVFRNQYNEVVVRRQHIDFHGRWVENGEYNPVLDMPEAEAIARLLKQLEETCA